MLQYNLIDETDGVTVTFLRSMGWGDVISVLVLFRVASWTWRFLRRELYNNSPTDTLRDYINLGLFLLCGFATIVTGSIVLARILRQQAVFQPSGIQLRRTFFGIPLRSTWFAEYEIYSFGLMKMSHTNLYALGFRASGSILHIYAGATSQEVQDFVGLLRAKGLEYNGEQEPRHRVSPAHGFLRQ